MRGRSLRPTKAYPVKTPSYFLAALSIAVGLGAPLSVASSRAAAATPPPPPPQLSPLPTDSPVPLPTSTLVVPSSSPSPLASPRRSRSDASATPSPPADNRNGLEGVWEVQVQTSAATEYSHFEVVKQTANALTGLYLDKSGKKFPLTGSLDGSTVRLIVSMNDGTTLLFQGRVDGTTDMIGLLTNAKGQTPFTAEYRPKEKFFDNINAQPGGLGSGLPGSPGGPPGIPPR